MKVFITASFKDEENQEEIEKLCALVRGSGFEDFCFIRDVENYQKSFEDPVMLMRRAKEEIEQCEALLIDLSEDTTVGTIEAGIAYTLGKPIITIMKRGTPLTDTVKGVSAAIIEYNQIEEIVKPLKTLHTGWENPIG